MIQPRKKPAKPRTKPPETRREELMNAALTLFLSRGVADTTIEDITRAADVAKGTFYLHFNSKEDVLAGLSQRFDGKFLAHIDAALARVSPTDFPARLTAWARASVEAYLELLPLHDLIFFQPHPHAHEHARQGTVDNVPIAAVRTLLAQGARAGAWAVEDPHLTAVFLFNGVHGAVDLAVSEQKSPSRSRLVRKIEQLCLRTVHLTRGLK